MYSNNTFHREIEDIETRFKDLKRNYSQQKPDQKLLSEIDKWETESVKKIKSTAKNVRQDLQCLMNKFSDNLNASLQKISSDRKKMHTVNRYVKNDIEQLNFELENFTNQLRKLTELKLLKTDLSTVELIKIEDIPIRSEVVHNISTHIVNPSDNKSRNNVLQNQLSIKDNSATRNNKIFIHSKTFAGTDPFAQPTRIFNFNQSFNPRIEKLFEQLQLLLRMDQSGPMSGKCHNETTQMENFLTQNFGFQNIRGKYIVDGVKSFQLDKPLSSMNRKKTIHFPNNVASPNSFSMSIQEILDWQKSYVVYADKNAPDMSKHFIQKALQGLIEHGKEAFRMKFVVRISTCPILMEFDAQIISRKIDEEWPHRIKLVSVCGVDFAGRIHDLYDILTYITNWQEVYEIDPYSHLPLVYNGRDFYLKKNGQRAQLQQDRLLNDLTRMARLRLRACDREKVEIVVETGIGLGVFSGRSIGIDDQVRQLSARAIRTVLEQDGSRYRHIKAVVFALPIFERHRSESVFQTFVDEFERTKYHGQIPILIIDQDMHRLTVAIARSGFIVSELNPGDSHGVFGEYWQNRGPALEEKLALTTVGLLVQHHLINPYVLNPDHYHLI